MPNVNVRCPFHLERLGRADRTPSCGVDIDLDVYHCFGCGASGRASQYPNLIAEARSLELNIVTADFTPTEFILPEALAGPARELLERRGFDLETLLRFEVGGDMDMIYFPLRVRDDTIVGVIHRMLFGETRYVYSRGFQRRNYLYGSRQFKAVDDKVFVVEGPLDCIKLHQLGMTNTIATMGNKISPVQRSLFRGLGANVVLAFDNDPAGLVSAEDQSLRLLDEGYQVSHLSYPGKDPGDLNDLSSVREISCVEFQLARMDKVDAVRKDYTSNTTLTKTGS